MPIAPILVTVTYAVVALQIYEPGAVAGQVIEAGTLSEEAE